MSYDENFMPTLEESANEAAAERQMQLDILYRIGCQYNVSRADIAAICQLLGIGIDELMKHSGEKK